MSKIPAFNSKNLISRDLQKENYVVQSKAMISRIDAVKRQVMRRSLNREQALLNMKGIIKPGVKRPLMNRNENEQPAKKLPRVAITAPTIKPALAPTIRTALAPTVRPILAPRNINQNKINVRGKPLVTAPTKNVGTFASKVNKEPAKAPAKPVMKPAPYDYKARFNLLLEKHKELKDQHANSAAIIAEAEKNFADTQQSLTKVESKHEELKTRYETLLSNYEEVAKKLSSLQETYQTVFDDNEQMKKELIDYKESIFKYEDERKALHEKICELKGNIRVFCRIRPPLFNEADKTLSNISILDDNNLIMKSVEGNKRTENVKTDFVFDHIFGTNTSQESVFEEVAQLVQSALDGYNVAIIAYGQTGSGKTFTMTGGSGKNMGIIPRTADLIFNRIPKLKKLGWDYTIKASFLEVYNERVKDLTIVNDKNEHDIRKIEGNAKDVMVTNTKILPITNAQQLKEYIEKAQKNRATAVTDFNEHSSRSHSITKIIIEGRNSSHDDVCYSTINLVDLAGSEKASTQNTNRLMETKNINKSLSSLSSVIYALVGNNSHIPYRNSKLTYLLMPCLGGNSKTLMLVNISSLDECWSESIQTLRFGSKVKSVKLSAAVKNRNYAVSNNDNE